MTTISKWEEDLLAAKYFYSDIALKDPYQSHFGLHGGRSGTILLQSILYLDNKSEELRSSIKDNYNYTLEVLNRSESIESSFCNGLAGWGWLNIHLIKLGFFPELNCDENLLELDKVLKNSLINCLENQDFDLLHGGLGIALYYLERKKESKLIRKVINSLKETCEIDEKNKECRWVRYDKYGALDYIYDFGLAHGNAGVLYFLNKCHQSGFKKETRELINGSIKFFLNNIQDAETLGSYFPTSIRKKNYGVNNITAKSRIAWCYGDLGILHSLLLATKEINDEAVYTKVVDMLKFTSKRKSKKSTELVDAGFCHGVAGVCIMFHSIYKITGNKIFQKSFNYWFEVMLKTGRNHSVNYVNYSFYRSDEVGWDKMADILTGLGGVVLATLTVKKDLDNWNSCFFLS